ncbi:hypothetical protein [Streptomyces sp. NPDC057909]|uniref:hypothetical protein n=1 Tax=Streptomyces sp. NPDC057909 TaxID=3346277 RepID=UPI0036F0E707
MADRVHQRVLLQQQHSPGGWVSSEVFDHTSVLRFLETWTSAIGKPPAACPNISAWRRKVTGDLPGSSTSRIRCTECRRGPQPPR